MIGALLDDNFGTDLITPLFETEHFVGLKYMTIISSNEVRKNFFQICYGFYEI